MIDEQKDAGILLNVSKDFVITVYPQQKSTEANAKPFTLASRIPRRTPRRTALEKNQFYKDRSDLGDEIKRNRPLKKINKKKNRSDVIKCPYRWWHGNSL